MTKWPITEPAGEGLPLEGESLVRWQETLDQLQQHAERAMETARNRKSVAPTDDLEGDWVPPVNVGALPSLLAGRARRLVAFQEQAANLVRESRSAVEHELGTLSSPRTPGQPVYLDVTG